MGRGRIRLHRFRLGIGLLFLSASASAQSPVPLAGTYTLLPEQSDDVRAAVRAATEDANFFVRKVGRGVLERTLAPARLVHIRFDSAGVSITAENDRLLHTPLGGATVRVRNERGEQEQVSTVWEGEALVREFNAGKAKRVYRYGTDQATGRLQVTVEVTGSMLPRALTYRLAYARVAGEP